MNCVGSRIPVLVISLPDSVRRGRIAPQLNAAGISYEFIDGVKINADAPLSQQGYSSLRSIIWKGRELSRGEVGCYLAHCRAMQFIKIRGYASAVILEDDAVLETHFGEVLERSIPLLDCVDVIKLQNNSASRSFESLNVSVGPHRLGIFSGGCYGSLGYLISKRGAATFLRRMLRPRVPLDDALDSWRSGLRVATWSPSVVTQDAQVASEIWSDHPPMTLRRAAGLQRLAYRMAKLYGKRRRKNESRKTKKDVERFISA